MTWADRTYLIFEQLWVYDNMFYDRTYLSNHDWLTYFDIMNDNSITYAKDGKYISLRNFIFNTDNKNTMRSELVVGLYQSYKYGDLN